jgi:hypothetical protein
MLKPSSALVNQVKEKEDCRVAAEQPGLIAFSGNEKAGSDGAGFFVMFKNQDLRVWIMGMQRCIPSCCG